MGLYIYAPVLTPTTKEVIDALQAKRLVRHDGMRFLNRGTPIEFSPADSVVCWGAHVPAIPNVPMLNTSTFYQSSLSFNERGLYKASTKGFMVLPAQVATPRTYRESLFDNWPKQRPIWNSVALREFENYVIPWMRLDRIEVIPFFKETVLTDDDLSKGIIVDVNSTLGLDFGVIHIGRSGISRVVIKIDTAPDVGQQTTEFFVKHISEWAKNANKLNREEV